MSRSLPVMKEEASLARSIVLAEATSVIVSQAVTDNLTKPSWIRRMFEEGTRLEQERGR
jgi:hypothetical protein